MHARSTFESRTLQLTVWSKTMRHLGSKALLSALVIVGGSAAVAGATNTPAASTLSAEAESLGLTQPPPPLIAESPPLQAAEKRLPSRHEFVEQFADAVQISKKEADNVFVDNQAISEFLEAHSENADFGGLWVTYEAGYEIHVRYVDERFKGHIAKLDAATLGPVRAHQGPNSLRDIEATSQRLGAAEIPNEIDVPAGHVRAYAESLRSPSHVNEPFRAADRALPALEVVDGPAPRTLLIDEKHAGADVWWWNGASWSTVCTAGAMWEAGQYTGYVWAAHCPQVDATNYTWTHGALSWDGWASVNTVCGNGGDYEFIIFRNSANVSNLFLDKRTNPAIHTVQRFAAGYYSGQPSFKVGLTANGTTGTNMGSVKASGYYDMSASYCGGNARYSMEYWHNSTNGDSGGPVYFFYNSNWYLGAIHSGRWGGIRYGTPAWALTYPALPGAHICHQYDPCN